MSLLRVVYGIILNLLIFGGLLFLPAWTLDWPRAWLFLGVVLIVPILSMAGLYRNSQALLRERFKPILQKGQPLEDKILLLIFVAAYFGCIIFIPLDVFRFHLLPPPGEFISGIGLLLFIAGWRVMYLALRENTFAAPVVKLQSERNHSVVDTGLYRLVRHPMYSGAGLVFIGMPLWLQSTAGTALALVPIFLLAMRILGEERFLWRALPGYEAYTRKVRYRLLPFLW